MVIVFKQETVLVDGTEWVEIIEPSRREHMFANLRTGQCLWEPPDGVHVKPTHENQWWELYDTNTKRYYYYNATSQKTVWHKPKDGDIIPLSKLQMLKAKEEVKQRRLSSDFASSQQQRIAANNINNNHSEHQQQQQQQQQQQKQQQQQHNRAHSDPEIISLEDISQETEDNNQQKAKDVNGQNHRKSSDEKVETYNNISLTNLKNEHNTKSSHVLKCEKTRNHVLSKNEHVIQNGQKVAYENVEINHRKLSLEKLGDGDSPEVVEAADSSPVSPMETLPADNNFSYMANKSATLPGRTSGSVSVAKFHSFKGGKGAPKKPPRTTVKREKNKENMGSNDDVQRIPDVQRQQQTAAPIISPKPLTPTKKTPSPPVSPMKVSEEYSDNDEPQYENLSSKRNKGVVGEPTIETPSSNIPKPPPPPPLPSPLPPYSGHKRLLPRSANTRSVYDNISDSGSYDENYLDISSSSNLDETFATSDESYTPSGTLLRNGETATTNRASYYERLRDNENVEPEVAEACPRTAVVENAEIEKIPPVKRSPLTRMKSDISDVEKRPKFSKNPDNIGNSGFRPMSMLNLTTSGKPLRKTCSGSVMPTEVKTSLNKHRKGIFRRKMSIHSMLSWSKTPIKKPMVMTRDKQQRKDALEVFKLILQCMGDKSCRKSFDTLAVEITTRGWQTAYLRDEIYVQLCKQTTGNEKLKSMKAGWELMTACLSIFPPSSKFHSYLEGYIYKYLDIDDLCPIAVEAQVDKYAKFCYKQLERICQTGAKRGLKGPTVDEIQSSIKRVFNPSMFGNTLEDIMEMQAERLPERRLPWILTTLTDAILLLNGLRTEGIFRVPGDIDGVNALKLQADRWEPNNQLQDPHVPASLLKLWFRDLYHPLIPQCFYDQCINNCNSAEVCLHIVSSLPPLNNLIFCYLIRLLQAFMIQENVSSSKMGEDNLAMVWAPNCLRCPSEDPREIFDNTRKEMTFLRTVMRSLNTSFLEGVV